MKIKEVLGESATGSLTNGVQHTLSKTYIFPNLQNQDYYMQYRMGVALASAHSEHAKEFDAASKFGENMTIVNYTPEEEQIMKLAMKLMGSTWTSGATQISTDTSEEAKDINKLSPVKPRGPVQRR